MSRTALILLAALVTTVAGCEWIDSMFAQDAGEPPLPPPPVMPTPVGPDPTTSLPPPTPTVPPLPPVVPVASDDGGAPEGAVAALVVDSGPADTDAGLAAVSPTPVEPTTSGEPSERRPTTTSSVPAVCRQYERCCRALGGSGGLMGLAGGCRNPSRMLTSADPERTCRQALAAVRSATAILPNRPSACR